MSHSSPQGPPRAEARGRFVDARAHRGADVSFEMDLPSGGGEVHVDTVGLGGIILEMIVWPNEACLSQSFRHRRHIKIIKGINIAWHH
jgi:hypothetical protein